MWQIFIKYKKPIIIGIVIIVIIIIIYVVARRLAIKNVPLPKDMPGMTSLSDTESDYIVNLSGKLYNNMKGISYHLFGANEDIYRELVSLSDTLFVGVYNYFNAKFGNGDTLRAWINGEFSMKGHDVIKTLNEKFDRLNLQ